MGADSKIEWTDHTFNPWLGCTKVGPGCDNCYAAAQDHRWKRGGARHWGSGVPRLPASARYMGGPLKWADDALTKGESARVFCGSTMDVFDNEVPDHWRTGLAGIVAATNHALDWIFVTKRIGNAGRMLDQMGVLPAIVVATCVDDAEWERDKRKLFDLRNTTGVKIGVSYEPALGPCHWRHGDLLDWLIVGGESEQPVRDRETAPFHIEWAIEARNWTWPAESIAIGPRVFVKQLGAKPMLAGQPYRTPDKAGRDMAHWPECIRIRDFWAPRRDLRSPIAKAGE